jgi:hypothetical protein
LRVGSPKEPAQHAPRSFPVVLVFLALVFHAVVSSPLELVTVRASREPARPLAARAPGENAGALTSRLRVLVRIDPRGAMKGFRIADVVDQVREIWRPYVDIDFANPGEGTAGVPEHDDELTLAITDRLQTSGSSSETALGWTEFEAGRPRSTVTVSVAAARSLMSQGRWLGRPIDGLPPPLQRQFVTHALSRSAAHEIGHYLLRSSAHAPTGLMRQRLTVADIMEDSVSVFRLRPSEVSVLERRAPHAPASAANEPIRSMQRWAFRRTFQRRS